ncbi:MAG: hypothetical protein ACXABY_10290 [Candidatus Thorarchaeota archaeon]|jgi:hypothetical protein
MALNQTPPQFSVGIDAKGKLICQEENLEPGVLKQLENFFVTVDAKFNHIFTLAASETDKQISFGSIDDAKVLFVYAQDAIEIKINSLGSAAIPVCPYLLLLANNAGIKELYLTNLGTATSVQVFVGA